MEDPIISGTHFIRQAAQLLAEKIADCDPEAVAEAVGAAFYEAVGCRSAVGPTTVTVDKDHQPRQADEPKATESGFEHIFNDSGFMSAGEMHSDQEIPF